MIKNHRRGYDEEIKELEDLLAKQRKIGNQEVISTSLNNVGMIYERRGQYDEAIKRFEESLKINKMIGNQQGISTTLNNVGLIHCDKGEYDEALKRFEDSLKINKVIGDEGSRSKILNNIGVAYNRKGEYDEALKRFEESVQLATELGDLNQLSYALTNVGLSKNYKGEYDAALKKYEESLVIQKKIGDEQGISLTLNNIGLVHYNKGEYDAALKKYEECLIIDRRLGNPRSLSYILNNIGLAYYAKGVYDEALKRFEESLQLANILGDQSIIDNASTNVINAKDKLISYRIATEFVRPNEKGKEIPAEAAAMNEKGKALANSGKFDEAKKYFDKALEIYIQYPEALCNKGLAILERTFEGSDIWNRPFIGNGIVIQDLMVLWEKQDEAIKYFDRAIEIDPTYNNAWYCKIFTLMNFKKFDESLQTYEKAITIDDTILDRIFIKHLQPEEIKLHLISKFFIPTLFENSQLEDIRKWVNKGLEICDKFGFKNERPEFLNLMGQSYYAEANFIEAYNWYIKAIKECSENDPLWNFLHISVTNVLNILGRPKEGDVYLYKVKPELFEVGAGRGYYFRYHILLAESELYRGNYLACLEILDNKLLPELYGCLESPSERLRSLTPDSLKNTLVDAIKISARGSWLKYQAEKYTGKRNLRDLEDAYRKAAEVTKYSTRSREAAIYYEKYEYLLHYVKEDFMKRPKTAKEIKDITSSLFMADLEIGGVAQEAKYAGNQITEADACRLRAECCCLLSLLEKNQGHYLADAEMYALEGLNLYDELRVRSQITDVRINSEINAGFQSVRKVLCFVLLTQGKVSKALAYSEVGKAREIFNEVSVTPVGCDKREELLGTINTINQRILLTGKE